MAIPGTMTKQLGNSTPNGTFNNGGLGGLLSGLLGGLKTGINAGAQGLGTMVNTMKAAGTMPDATNSDPANKNMGQAGYYLDQLGKLESTPFHYDVNTDASYAALRDTNMKNAQLATKGMTEQMNDRGIMNSTITSDRAANIYKQGSDATTAAIPQLEANAYNRNQQNISNMANLSNAYLNMSNSQNATQMQQAALTGKYLPPGAKGLMDQIIAAKQRASADPSNVATYKGIADQARQQLTGMGYDANTMFGPNVGLADAQNNESKAGMTIPYQEAMMGALTNAADKYPQIPVGTGAAMSQVAPGFQNVANYYTNNLEGKDLYNSTYLYNSFKNNIAYQRLGIQQQRANQAGVSNNIASNNALNASNGNKATQGYASNALTFPTREKAIEYLVQNKENILKDGGSITGAMDTVNKRYGGASGAGTSGSPNELFKQAVSMAQSDGRWKATIDADGNAMSAAQIKENQDALIKEWQDKLSSLGSGASNPNDPNYDPSLDPNNNQY